MFKYFQVAMQKVKKSLNFEMYRHFQMHSSFKFYLSNEASNEFEPETKVVAFEVLNNFRIQKFFV